jgi:hypothetical protein
MEAAKEIGETCIPTRGITSAHPTIRRGRSGEEIQDYDYSFANARRRSNSSTQGLADFRTKFEGSEPEPMFEEAQNAPDVTSDTATKVESVSSGNDSEVDQDGIKY